MGGGEGGGVDGCWVVVAAAATTTMTGRKREGRGGVGERESGSVFQVGLPWCCCCGCRVKFVSTSPVFITTTAVSTDPRFTEASEVRFRLGD